MNDARVSVRIRAMLAALGAIGAAGCAQQCKTDDECPDLWACVDEVCIQECLTDEDCPVDTECARGACVEEASGEVTWVSPSPGDAVDARFAGALDVRFRAPAALLTVVRDPRDEGDDCAGVPPLTLRLVGDPNEAATQRVELPDLFSGGASFSLVARLEAAGGSVSAPLKLRGPEAGATVLRIASPSEGVLEGDPVWVDVAAERLGAAQTLGLRTEPVRGEAGATQTLAPDAVGALVPLARGRQLVRLAGTDPAGDPFACTRGYEVAETGAGLELALWFEATAGESLVRMRVRVDDGAETTVCTTLEPSGPCETVREVASVAPRGDEILRIADTPNAVLEVAVVPEALSEPVRAGVRVSYEGRHVAFLGPFQISPMRGEVWIAGDITLAGGVPLVAPRFDVQQGAPF